ncbi:MAG: Gfo/Idh/MocA family protein [Microthrixaceae bacterium]
MNDRNPHDAPHAPAGIALVGAGYWGPNLARNFLGCPGTDLRWIVDLDTERARAIANGRPDVRVTSELAEALEDPEVRGVAVATPPASHLPLAEAALRSGRHVLVEKPLATTAADGERLARLADDLGLVLMCDHTFCYTPVVRAISGLVRSGELGDIQYVDSIRVNLGLIQSDVDVFWDLAPHDLSVLDHILPDGIRPEAIAAHGADPIGSGQACVGYLTIPLTGGAIAHVTVNWLSPSKIRQMVIAGSRKMAVWDDMKPSQRLSILDSGVELRVPEEQEEKRRLLVDYRVGDMLVPALPEGTEALRAVVEEFADCMRTGRSPLTDGWAGVRILRLLEAASVSLRSNSAMISVPDGS